MLKNKPVGIISIFIGKIVTDSSTFVLKSNPDEPFVAYSGFH
jgi:hypothetical protein